MGDRFSRTTRRRFLQTSAMVGTGVLVGGRRAFGQSLDPIKNLRKFVGPLPLPGSGLCAGDAGQDPLQPDRRAGRLLPHRDGAVPAVLPPGPPVLAALGLRGRDLRPAEVALPRPGHRRHQGDAGPHQLHQPAPAGPPAARRHDAARAPRPARRSTARPSTCTAASCRGPATAGRSTGRRRPARTGRRWSGGCPNRLGTPDRRLLVPERAERAPDVVPRPRVGITRLNAYAGLAARLRPRRRRRARGCSAQAGSILPGPAARDPARPPGQELQERWPTPFGGVGRPRLPVRLRRAGGAPGGGGYPNLLPDVSCVPEFFADTPVINGMAYPAADAARRRPPVPDAERHAVARLEPAAVPGGSRRIPATRTSAADQGPDFISDRHRGRLPAGAGWSCRRTARSTSTKYHAHDPTGYGLVLAGAERADVLIDFSDCAGQSFILYNDARLAVPDGGDAASTTTRGTRTAPGGPPARGPNTRTLMRITIEPGAYAGPTDDRRPDAGRSDAELAQSRASGCSFRRP